MVQLEITEKDLDELAHSIPKETLILAALANQVKAVQQTVMYSDLCKILRSIKEDYGEKIVDDAYRDYKTTAHKIKAKLHMEDKK